MTELTDKHFEVIDGNKQKAFEDRKKMREELKDFAENCNSYELMKMYDEYRRLKRK